MLKADLHGKISSSGPIRERQEDVLTSNVFGALDYADAKDLLLAWLGDAENLDHELLTVRFPAAPAVVDLRFWPTMTMPPGKRMRTREPDLLVLARDAAHRPTFGVCVEAKLDSGLSQQDGDEDVDEPSGGVDVHDQLADQYIGLHDDALDFRDRAGDELRRRLPTREARVLVFLTRHTQLPREILEESVQRVTRDHPGLSADCQANLYWLSWYSLTRRLMAPRSPGPRAPGQEHLLHDLRLVLEKRKLRLDPFEDFLLRAEAPSSDDCAPWLTDLIGIPRRAPPTADRPCNRSRQALDEHPVFSGWNLSTGAREDNCGGWLKELSR